MCLAGSMIESELTISEASCLHCNSEEEALQLIGFVEPLFLAYLVLIEIARFRRGDIVPLKSSDGLLRQVLVRVVHHFEGNVEYTENDRTIGAGSITAIIDADGDLNFEKYRTVLALGARLIRLNLDGDTAVSDIEIELSREAVAVTRINAQDLMQMEPAHVSRVLDAIRVILRSTEERQKPRLRVFGLDEIPEAVKFALDTAKAERTILKCRRGYDGSCSSHSGLGLEVFQ